MANKLMWALAGYYLITGLYISILPLVFYETAPGVAATGPYNMHFLRDVGFAFTVSALGLGYGLWLKLKPLIVFGTAWLAIHGAFHLVLWFLQEHPASPTALIDLVLVVLPAAGLSYLAARYRT
ncbi:MAG: hypothetical protein AAF513_02510 [Pseudomonadota bacterium]